MKMSKERMESKLNTWLKHVEAGDSKFFFECNAYTGLRKEVFVEELKWLFEDPQDAVTETNNPYTDGKYSFTQTAPCTALLGCMTRA